MTDLVKQWRGDVVSKAKGRTRYDGQPPFADEAVAAYIDALEAELQARKLQRDTSHKMLVESVEAGDRIEAENERLRVALTEVYAQSVGVGTFKVGHRVRKCADIARAALAAGEKPTHGKGE